MTEAESLTYEGSDAKLKDEYELLNHRPIEFYGKVIDQYGQPVAGTEVQGTLAIRTPSNSGVEKHKTVTDGNGNFQFKGLEGEAIGMWPIKGGYEFSGQDSNFVYSLFYGDRVHKPDPNNPVIFKMWKLAGPEPMIEGQKFFKIKPNGPEYTIDLVNGKKIEGKSNQGDFIVRVHRPAIVSPKDRYDWSFEIEPVDGGIIETDGPFPYLAPEIGYKPNYLHMVTTSQTNWSYNVGKLFYIKSRAGRVHARVQVAIYADYPDGSALDLKYYANPSGSRNLEFDPKKRLTKDEIAKLGAALNR